MTSRRSLASRLTIELGGALGPAWLAQRAAARRATPMLRVINLHGTPARHADQLRRHLEWLASSFSLIDPDRLGDLWQPGVHIPDPGPRRLRVLVTFDDGLASNFEVAAPILDSLGVRAVFFVTPRFAELQGDRARDYYYRQVQPWETMPAGGSEEDWRPMTPEQIRRLGSRHWIGNHTFSHRRLDEVPDSELALEIVESRRTLQKWTGTPVDAFAWTFSASTIDRRSLHLAATNHRFVFSPCPGTIDPAVDPPTLIWRASVEAGWTRAAWRFMLSGLGDARWTRARRKLREKAGDPRM